MAPPTHLFYPLPHPRPGDDTDNAVHITNLFRAGGEGTTVLLSPGQVYPLYSLIDLSHPGCTLATAGYPAFETGQQAVLETRSEKEAGAVKLFQLSRTALKRVHIRGCRGWGATPPENDEAKEQARKDGKMGWLEGGGSLVWMGGPGCEDSVVEGCRLEDPRGWTAVHLVDWALRCKVINNIVGPSGQQAPGPWADGLSIAGKDSLIAGNTVIDATDGAIVVFCAPGSVVTDNTIIARERNLLGAINMVDDFPFDRDFTDTRVVGNRIRTEGAFIRLAIGCGPTSWNPWGPHHTLNYGAQVLHNYIGPGQFGYGISASGTKNFTIQGNSLLPGTRFAGATHRFYPATINAPPTAFVAQWSDRGRVVDCHLQPDFVEGEVQWLIGIEPEVGDKLEYEAGQVRLDVRGMSRAGEGGIAMKGLRWEVGRRGELLARKVDGADKFGMGEYGKGRVVWTSGNAEGTKEVDEPQLDFNLDGSLTLRSHGGTGDVLWSPTSYLFSSASPSDEDSASPKEPTPPEQWRSRPKLILQTRQPYLQLRDKKDNLVFSTSYRWNNQDGWGLGGGKWIAVAPEGSRGREVPEGESYDAPSAAPPPVPQRPSQQGGEEHKHAHGGFGRFVRDLGSTLQQHGVDLPAQLVGQSFPNFTNPYPTSPAARGGPPPIPPRPGSGPDAAAKPTYLYLDPHTCQLILHSSPSGPAHPQPEFTHWVAPPAPVEGAKDPWVSFQGDGNLVLYTSVGAVWASGTNGGEEHGAEWIVLDGRGERGPRVEMWSKKGERVWTSD
ncbi:hypothetical protein JCM10207_009222 [Rhodosporidiobolus poonsookiae]